MEWLVNKHFDYTSAELTRIINLPFSAGNPDPRHVTNLLKSPGGQMALRPIQAAAIKQMSVARGLFGRMPVGSGKTLVALLTGIVFYPLKIACFTKSNLKEELYYHIRQYSPHWAYTNEYGNRVTGFPPPPYFRIFDYESLSTSNASTLLPKVDLEKIRPDVLVFDEAHLLANLKSARTGRIASYLEANPATIVIGLTGSWGNASIWEYQHLIKWCLKDKSPIPRNYSEIEAWAGVLDSGKKSLPSAKQFAMFDPIRRKYATSEDYTRHQVDLIHSDFELADPPDKIGVCRAAYRRRLNGSFGVVSSSEDSTTTPLQLEILPLECPQLVQDVLKKMDQTWTSPDGEEVFVEAMDAARHERNVETGFWLKWDWPNGKKDQEWIDIRSELFKSIREAQQEQVRGADTPALLIRHCRRVLNTPVTPQPDELDLAGISEDDSEEEELVLEEVVAKYEPSPRLLRAYTAWLRVKDRPHPPTKTIWISDFMLQDLQKLLNEHPKITTKPTIIWYYSQAMEAALSLLRYKGQPLPVFPADTRFDQNVPVTCAISMAHAVGKNLQAWSQAIVLENPPRGRRWQQMLGRLHRSGQEAPVWIGFYGHSKAYRKAFERALDNARFMEETEGPQKLLAAEYLGESWLTAL